MEWIETEQIGNGDDEEDGEKQDSHGWFSGCGNVIVADDGGLGMASTSFNAGHMGMAWEPGASGAPGFATAFPLNQTTDALEFIFSAREAITITKLGIRMNAITGTTPTYRISLQGVGTTGNPDGTIKGATNNALATFSPSGLSWSAGTFHWLTLTESYTCSRGEMLACVVDYSSGTVDASNFANFSPGVSANAGTFPYPIQNDNGTRTRVTGTIATFGYASNSQAYGRPMQSIGSAGITSTGTPDEYAMLITLPAGWGSTYKIGGLHLDGGMAAAGTCKFLLYDTDGTTVLQTKTFDQDDVGSTAVRIMDSVHFDDATLATLNFGSTYRLSIQPQGIQAATIVTLTQSAAGDWAAWPWGTAFTLSTRTDAGAWTDDATSRLLAGIIVDSIDPGSAGGTTIAGTTLLRGMVG